MYNIKTAINHYIYGITQDIFSEPVSTYARLAVEALKKQVPTEPYYSGDGYFNGELVYDTWQCPNCGEYYEVDYDTFDYCPNCGQRIKWE